MPVVVGFGVIAAVIVASRLLPRSWLRSELGRWYGAKPSGAYWVMSRRDLGRRSLYSAIAAGVLLTSSIALFPLSERFPNGSKPRLILETYFFIGVVLGAVAALAAIVSGVRAAFWRPRRLPLTLARRLNLAHYLELMRRGELAGEAWRDFAAIRFEDPVAEQIRAEYVTRVGPVARELSDIDALWLKECVGTLVAGAVTAEPQR